MKTKKFIVWYILVGMWLLCAILGYILYGCKIAIANLEKDLYTAKQKTKIELVKDELYANKNTIAELKNAKEQANIKYSTTIWYGRCLETIGELELKLITYNLECDINNYKELEKFATYSLHKTRQELGL